jgi:hypothetical protein
MAAAPDNGMLRPPGPPPLGAILVRRGLLTEPQLEAALAESKRTGEPTGEVIVRLGFASAATIAQALATQHGGPLKTEYGYAVGFGAAAPAVTAAASPAAPPVSPVPAQDERPAASAPASAARAAPPVDPVLAPAPVPAAPVPAAAPPQPDPVLLQWQQHAQQLAAHRDAALRELEETKVRLAELEVAAVVRDTDLAAQKDLERARADAEARNAELERELAELRASAAADDGHLAAATARVAELESSAARDAGLQAELAKAREEAARVHMEHMEKVALEAAHESMAVHTADLEEKLKALEATTARTAKFERQLEEAIAQIAQLEAERDDVLAVAKAVGEQKRGRHPDDHADDPRHLLFVPGREGYRLVEQEGPPPAAGSTVEFPEDDGTSSTLLVTKVGASPLPGARLACAYLVTAA